MKICILKDFFFENRWIIYHNMLSQSLCPKLKLHPYAQNTKATQGTIPSCNFSINLLNTHYLEIATWLVSTFTLIHNAVAKGGPTNMLTGAERSETLWAINDKLSELNKKIHWLYLSIRYYTLLDVWHNLSAGMIERNLGIIAR